MHLAARTSDQPFVEENEGQLYRRCSVDSSARWNPQFARLMPGLEIRVWPQIGDRRSID
jgi:hypothetical protein